MSAHGIFTYTVYAKFQEVLMKTVGCETKKSTRTTTWVRLRDPPRGSKKSGEQRHEEICGREKDGVGYTGVPLRPLRPFIPLTLFKTLKTTQTHNTL